MNCDLDMARALAQAAKQAGGQVYYAGGCVRDKILGLPVRDLDLEVHGLTESQLQRLLATLGTPLTMGESFRIYGLKGYNLDISLPRGSSRTLPEPFVGPKAAAARRDFTCNAMMEDVLTGEILDFFGGQQDLRDGILRHVEDSSFQEDPLRVLRAARFCARFSLTVAPETSALCRKLPLGDLPRERVWEELKKALLESRKPSVFFTVLRDLDQLDPWFPQLKALIGVPQPPKYHAEGDVWNHTMLVLDQAANLQRYVDDPLVLLLAALTHDYGKAVSTQLTDTGIHAYGHETAGLPLVRDFLQALTNQKDLIHSVQNLVKLHMRPNMLAAQNASLKATNKLLDEALEPRDLLCLAAADDLGRVTDTPHVSKEAYFSERLHLYEARMAEPSVTGEDLIRAGVRPTPRFSEYLTYAHKLHLSGVKKSDALTQTLQFIRKHP